VADPAFGVNFWATSATDGTALSFLWLFPITVASAIFYGLILSIFLGPKIAAQFRESVSHLTAQLTWFSNREPIRFSLYWHNSPQPTPLLPQTSLQIQSSIPPTPTPRLPLMAYLKLHILRSHSTSLPFPSPVGFKSLLLDILL
jgi:hypothetical protein